jgi:hypothetical protein
VSARDRIAKEAATDGAPRCLNLVEGCEGGADKSTDCEACIREATEARIERAELEAENFHSQYD